MARAREFLGLPDARWVRGPTRGNLVTHELWATVRGAGLRRLCAFELPSYKADSALDRLRGANNGGVAPTHLELLKSLEWRWGV